MPHGILLIRRESLMACRLPDDELTFDRVEADKRFPPKELPHRAESMPTTPSRVATLDALVAAGQMSGANAQVLVRGGRVPDAAWAFIQEVEHGSRDGHASPNLDFEQLHRWSPAARDESGTPVLERQWTPVQVRCWTAVMQHVGEVAPVAFDPLACTDPEFPMDQVVRALDALSLDGWSLLHVSEDRGVEADASFVSAVRYLLVKPRPVVRDRRASVSRKQD